MMTDPIADMLTRVRNASRARHEKVEIPSSRLKMGIAKILKREGFIKNYKLVQDSKQGLLRIYLKYNADVPVITNLARVSKPSRRVYRAHDNIPKPGGGFLVTILTTSKGVMTDKDAKANKVGGELICVVW